MWWLLTVWIVGSLPLGVLTARFIAIGNKPMRYEPPLSWHLAQLLPPGDDWTLWRYEPPAYKRGRVIEVWTHEMGAATTFLKLDEISPLDRVAGYWWRPA